MANFDFELTISGLCVVVLKADDDRPTHPSAVDLLLVRGVSPDGAVHKPRLSFWPSQDVTHNNPFTRRLEVNPRGRKHASIDIEGRVVRIEHKGGGEDFQISWAQDPEMEVPPDVPGAEELFDWVPHSRDLGLLGIHLPQNETDLPTGSAARLILPPGDLLAQEVVREGGEPVRWKFPATGKERAIANQILYRAKGVRRVSCRFDSPAQTAAGEAPQELTFLGGENVPVEIGVTNDVGELSPNYNGFQQTIVHLESLNGISTKGTVQPPSAVLGPAGGGRTARPICNQVRFRS